MDDSYVWIDIGAYFLIVHLLLVSFADLFHSTVFKESEKLEGKCIKIEGYDFNQGVNYPQLFKSFISTGFQAFNLGEAVEVVNQMLEWRLSDEVPGEDCCEEERDPAYRESVRCKVDVVVTTAGGLEEDLIKCLAPTCKCDFSLPGAQLRSKGLNRIGNLLVPNDNYCRFEDWIIPIFDKMLEEQSSEKIIWTPSKVIARLGKEINHKSSYLYWAYKIMLFSLILLKSLMVLILALVLMRLSRGEKYGDLPRL